MNKELILKYKPEFEHQLYGGKLRHKDSTGTWIHTRDIWDCKTEDIQVVIIDDKYVEFRKALAEGKTIQYYRCIYTHEICCSLDKYEWIDLQTSIFDKPVESYRIKPEESSLKVGDWVRDITSGKIHQVDNILIVLGDYSQFIKWKPKPDEYCWFYKRGSNNPVFAKFVRNIESNLGSYEAVGFVPNGPSESDEEQFGYFDKCEPFIGTLPTGLKDK